MPVTAAELVRSAAGAVPRLLFVSACLTATGADDPGHLPPGSGHKGGTGAGSRRAGWWRIRWRRRWWRRGCRRCSGWDGSVGDRAATVFAERLYRGLADRGDLAVAVGDARRALLESEDPVVRADWHLARLWLGPGGGGPLVAGSRKRSLVTATRGTKMFLDRKQQVPVAAAEMFVGRRPELQQALRALRSGDRAGVLLHGQGRLGKSSLAARIADRCPDFAVAVVFGDYGALAVLDAVAAAVRTNPAARQLIESRLPEVRDRPEAIGAVLIDLLAGPCAQAGRRTASGRCCWSSMTWSRSWSLTRAARTGSRPGHAPVLAAVLRAFDPACDRQPAAGHQPVHLRPAAGCEDRLEAVQLRPLSPVAQRKLRRRQQALTPAGRLAERAGLAAGRWRSAGATRACRT